MTDRYARQIILPEIGAEGQVRLARARVVVVGAGGLGSAVLPTLAGAGVGTLVIVDDDRVEESNLHRQPLFTMDDIGHAKAKRAAMRLVAYNPDVRVQAMSERLTPANAAALIAWASVVIDAADTFAVSYTLSDACRDANVPLVSASVLGFTGYVGAFCGGGADYRAVFPDLPPTAGACDTNGVMGSAVQIIGSLQAHMALALLLGLEPSPLGRMITVDLKTLTFGGFDFSAASLPERAAFSFIDAGEITPHDRVIDVRGLEEAPQAIVPGALRFLPDQMDEPASLWDDKAARVVVCCKTGVRARRAARRLETLGFTNIALVAAGRAAC